MAVMPEMSSKTFGIIAWSMVVVAAVAYINNVIVTPSLRAPDGFGHFTYIWTLAATGSVPLATEGWSFFHPPLYYAFMAAVWQMLGAVDPVVRLKIGTGFISFLGIAQAGVAYLIVRRCLPTNRVAQLLAVGIMLFLPLQLFTAGYLSNERLNAAFCGTSLLALLWVLDRPVWSRAAVLGLLLGLALLVKYTALAIVAGSFATIFLSFLSRRQFVPGLKILAIVGIVMFSVCGWFYIRNIVRYDTPFKMSRDTEMVQRVENLQTEGKRDLLEFLLFDPLIITSPQWPRGGLPISGKVPPGVVRSSLRESVWTGVYANAWFEGQGGLIIPLIRQSTESMHSGQMLLALALVPTLLVLIGICTTIVRLWRDGWNDVYAAMLIPFVAMMTVFVYGMKMVPLHGAVKAAYLTPVSVVFAFWLAMGFDAVCRVHKGVARGAVAVCSALAVVSIGVFSLGAIVGRDYLRDGLNNAVWQNLYGIVEYAGGNEARALEMFRAAALDNWHLGHENVAAMALEAGRPREAVSHLRAAARLQPMQSFGLPADRRRFDNSAQAEYSTLLSVAHFRLGRPGSALRFAADAVKRDRTIPEANYNLGVLKLVQSLSLPEDEADGRALIEDARDDFQHGWDMDSAFGESMAMKGVAEALLGDCDRARSSFERADEATLNGRRLYPLETGTGDMHSAGINRRLRIRNVPEQLKPGFQRRRCIATAG
jgi:tetratricopeptide (TPR) repeat protein